MRDFDYYVGRAREAEEKSAGLWLAINALIRSVMETQRKRGRTLRETAAVLEKIAGPAKKTEPAPFANIRTAARRMRAGGELKLPAGDGKG